MGIFNFRKRKKTNEIKTRSVDSLIGYGQSFFNSLQGMDGTTFSCIDKIASSVASLSYGVYDKNTKQKIRHRITDLLDEPNAEDIHFNFMYRIVKDYFENGNIYIYKYLKGEEVISIFRLPPESVIVKRDSYNNKIFGVKGKEYTSQNVLHIPARFGYDGNKGYSVFDITKGVFDVTQALAEYTNNTFGNTIEKRLIIDITKAYPDATEEEQRQLRERFIQNYSGTQNAGIPIVKTGNIEFQTIDTGISDNRGAQLQENRKFSQEVIAQMFNIPYGLLDGSAIDLETITTLFMTQAVQPITKTLEESFIKLIPLSERRKVYLEFNYNSILKTSLSNKIDAYTKQLSNGILTPNEIRQKENLSDIEAGSYAFVPANLMPLTEENIKAYMAKSKMELSQLAGTTEGKGSDKI